MSAKRFVTHTMGALAFVLALAGAASADLIYNTDQHWTVSGANTADDFFFTNWPTVHTWTVDPGVVFSLGNGSANAGRVFPGAGSGSPVGPGAVALRGGGTLILDGHHSADSITMRLGHEPGNRAGLVQILDGSTLILGGRRMRFSGTGGSRFEILDGILDLSRPGFSFQRTHNATLSFGLGDAATILVPDANGIIDSWADFQGWAAGVSAGTASPGHFTLDFIQNYDQLAFAHNPAAGTTRMWTIPEPGAWMLLLSALAAGMLLRRRRTR